MKSAPILVITPTLGDSRFLDQTMESVRAQPLNIIHVLSVPERKREELQKRYPSAIVCADAGKAGGIYGAINAGLARATFHWEWFTYINDDDGLLPGFSRMCQRHVVAARSEGIAYGEVDLIDEENRVISGVTIEPRSHRFPALLQSGVSPLMQQGTLFSRKVVRRLREFDVKYRLCADLDFWLRAFARGETFLYYPERVAQFRIRAGQLSADTLETRKEQDQIVARLFPKRISPVRRQWAVWCFRLANRSKYIKRSKRFGLRRSYSILTGDTPLSRAPG